MSRRRLSALIAHLPRESALQRELHGAAATWGVAEHLQAATLDAIRVGNWQRSGDKKIPRPKPLPRPRDKAKPVSAIDPRRLHAARQRANARRRRIEAGEIT